MPYNPGINTLICYYIGIGVLPFDHDASGPVMNYAETSVLGMLAGGIGQAVTRNINPVLSYIIPKGFFLF